MNGHMGTEKSYCHNESMSSERMGVNNMVYVCDTSTSMENAKLVPMVKELANQAATKTQKGKMC